jgi:hypothetical protein
MTKIQFPFSPNTHSCSIHAQDNQSFTAGIPALLLSFHLVKVFLLLLL